MSIPKVIHCVWVGEKPIPRLHRKCIKSWKKYLPGHQLKIWTEHNFPISSNRFCAEAYDAKQYAFVSDYIRMFALYHEGGIYMDTDVEMLRPFSDDMLQADGFMGYETCNTLSSAVLGFAPGHKIPGTMLASYNDIGFINEDGTRNDTPNVHKLTSIAVENGLNPCGTKQFLERVVVYLRIYFSPLPMGSEDSCISKDTYTIHHYSGTWLSHEVRFYTKWKHGLQKRVSGIIGNRLSGVFYRIAYNFCRLLDRLSE